MCRSREMQDGVELLQAGDFKAAFEAFMRGAENGSQECVAQIVLCYQNGIGVEKSKQKCEEWQWRLKMLAQGYSGWLTDEYDPVNVGE